MLAIATIRSQPRDVNLRSIPWFGLLLTFVVACGGDDDGGQGGGSNQAGEAGAPGGSAGTSGTSGAGGSSGSAQGGTSGTTDGGHGGDDGGHSGTSGTAGLAGEAGEAGAAGAAGNGETGGSAGVSGSGGTPNGGTGGAGAGGAGTGGFAGSVSGGAGAGGAGAGGGGAGAGGASAGSGGSSGITTCPGAPDPSCSCLKVTRNGNDASAVTSGGTTPFRSVQAAIDYAGTGPNVPVKVCVAGWENCTGGSTYYEAPRMRDGVSVYGNYQSTGWTRCSGINSILISSQDPHLLFGSDISHETVLDGFLTMFDFTMTFDGARGAVVTNVEMSSGPVPAVAVLNGADVRIAASNVYYMWEAVGIQVTGSRIVLDDVEVRGGDVPTALSPAYAVVLDGAVGSQIVRSSLEGAGGTDVAAVRIVGAATGIEIRESSLVGLNGGTSTRAISLESCSGASPLITNNPVITASSTRRNSVSAISVAGDCDPRIENNPAILVSAPVGAPNVTGISCGASSNCVITGNRVSNAQPGFMAGDTGTVTGVACADACVRIADNDISAGSPGCSRQCTSTTYGLSTGGTTLVERNAIAASSVTSATGVLVGSGTPRLQNNVIRATVASAGTGGPIPTGNGYGVNVSSAVDVHSNTIIATRVDNMAPGALAGAALSGGGATLRNNILLAGVRELNVSADPAIFENNHATVYFDEASGVPTNGAAAINALTDMTVSGTIDQDPAFVSYPNDLHLTGTSPCIGAGTAVGAPTDDKDRATRTPPPDIGAYEYTMAMSPSGLVRGVFRELSVFEATLPSVRNNALYACALKASGLIDCSGGSLVR